jgi:hypothetical protein
MDDRIEKDLKDLDTSKVDFDDGHWCSGKGGFPLQDHEWSINYVDDDLIMTRYKLPQCINEMLANQYRFGYNQAKSEIINALNRRMEL